MFPALERKHAALANVATSYTMDHAEETQLFAELGAVIADIQGLVRLSPSPLRHRKFFWYRVAVR